MTADVEAKVSTEVCVVTYDSSGTLAALVDSLRLLPSGSRLAVHDNSPDARDLGVAERLAEAMGLAFRGEACSAGNCGFAAACNSLAAGSSAEDLLFLNPDAHLLTWPADLRAQGRIVGPRIVDEHGAPAVSYGVTRTLADEVRLRWARVPASRPRGSGYVSGAALLVGRGPFLRLGGFDETFFMYYEDVDLCLRASGAGVPVWVDESWLVAHVGGHSVGRSAEGLRSAHLRSYASARRFHAKHGRSVRAFDALALADAALRAALRAPSPARRNIAAADWAVARAAASALVSVHR